MTLLNASLIRKAILFLVAAAMISMSVMATGFNQPQRLANQGNALAQFKLGVMYDEGNGVAQNTAKAFEWYQKAAEQGNASAQFNIGWMYEHADSVSQDSVKAVEWYRKAADQGYGVVVNYFRAASKRFWLK